MKMSGFVLSILSPVWKAKICSVFRFANKRLDLTNEDAASFLTAVKLGCGHSMTLQGGLGELLDVGRLADMYRIEHVHQAVEWEAEQWLTVNTCGELLARSCNAGMPRLEKCCRELALERFEAVARTEGFMRLDEEQLGSLLDDDGLKATREEAVLEAVVRWMGAYEAGSVRGKGLLTKVRFPLMPSASLAGLVLDMAPRLGGLQALVGEAMDVQEGRGSAGPKLLGGKANVPRPFAAAEPRPWFIHELSQQINLFHGQVHCLAATRNWDSVFAGIYDDKFVAVDRIDPSSSGRAVYITAALTAVSSMVLWKGWVVTVSGGQSKVWQKQSNLGVSSWQCIGLLDKGERYFSNLVLVGTCDGDTRLVTARKGSVVKVWTVGNSARTWVCEHTIKVAGFECLSCFAVSAAATSIAGGDSGGKIPVWDAASGARLTTLLGHLSQVKAIWIDSEGLKLISASDGAVKVWDVQAQACVATLFLGEGLGGGARSLAVSEGRLFLGVRSTVARGDEGSVVAVRVWDLSTMEEALPIRMQTRLALGESIEVKQVLVRGSEVWAVVNRSLVVWRAPGGWAHRLGLWLWSLRMNPHAAAGLYAMVIWRCGYPDRSRQVVRCFFCRLLEITYHAYFQYFVLWPYVFGIESTDI
jgi:hypothetical protein